MNEHDDVMCLVRESFSGLRMDLPVEDVFAQAAPAGATASSAMGRRRQPPSSLA